MNRPSNVTPLHRGGFRPHIDPEEIAKALRDGRAYRTADLRQRGEHVWDALQEHNREHPEPFEGIGLVVFAMACVPWVAVLLIWWLS